MWSSLHCLPQNYYDIIICDQICQKRSYKHTHTHTHTHTQTHTHTYTHTNTRTHTHTHVHTNTHTHTHTHTYTVSSLTFHCHSIDTTYNNRPTNCLGKQTASKESLQDWLVKLGFDVAICEHKTAWIDAIEPYNFFELELPISSWLPTITTHYPYRDACGIDK